MYRFETTLAYGKNKVIHACNLEIIGYLVENEEKEQILHREIITLNRQEVKELLELMQEAYAKMGTKIEDS